MDLYQNISVGQALRVFYAVAKIEERKKLIETLNSKDNSDLLKEIVRHQYELPELRLLALNRLDPSESEFFYALACEDDDADFCVEALKRLDRKSPANQTSIKKIAANFDQPEVLRKAAIDILATLNEYEFLENIATNKEDPDWDVRIYAIDLLDPVKERKSLRIIAGDKEDDNDVRCAACEMLDPIMDYRQAQAVASDKNDEWDVRVAAIGLLHPRADIDRLRTVAADETDNRRVREAAVEKLNE